MSTEKLMSLNGILTKEEEEKIRSLISVLSDIRFKSMCINTVNVLWEAQEQLENLLED